MADNSDKVVPIKPGIEQQSVPVKKFVTIALHPDTEDLVIIPGGGLTFMECAWYLQSGLHQIMSMVREGDDGSGR